MDKNLKILENMDNFYEKNMVKKNPCPRQGTSWPLKSFSTFPKPYAPSLHNSQNLAKR